MVLLNPGRVCEKKNYKADMNSDIPLETAAIFFLANLYLKQGISSECVMAVFIVEGFLDLQGAPC